jgi:hypothetical protein
MSNNEKLIKKLNENKELIKLKEQQTKENSTGVRVQQLKKTLITLATDLLVEKKIKASVFKNILSLTFTNITENELNYYYNKLNVVQKVEKDVKKAEALQGPTKIRKVTLKDFKGDAKLEKHKKELDEIFEKNANRLKQYDNLVPYEGFVNDKGDSIYFHFYNHITDEYLYKVSEEYLEIKKNKIGSNKDDYIPIEKTEHTRKKTFDYPFNGNVTKI